MEDQADDILLNLKLSEQEINVYDPIKNGFQEFLFERKI